MRARTCEGGFTVLSYMARCPELWRLDPVAVDRLIAGRPIGRLAKASETLTALHYLRTVRGMDETTSRTHVGTRLDREIEICLAAREVGFEPTLDYWTQAFSYPEAA